MTIEQAAEIEEEILGLRADIEYSELMIKYNREEIPKMVRDTLERERDIALWKMRILELGGKVKL